MRHAFLGLAGALALLGAVPSGSAYGQIGNIGSDPFSFYYGYYLPHAAAVAAQPTPLDSINQNIAQRQMAAQTDRAALYDPISPYGAEDEDTFGSSGRRTGTGRARVAGFSTAGDSTVRGNGPSLYYNRTARYFPTLRTGRGPNRNLAVVRGRSGAGGMGGMGGMSMPSMPSMPGPR